MKFRFHRSLARLLGGASVAWGSAAQAQEPQLDLNLRSFYMNRDYRDGSDDRLAASQSLHLHYRSAFLDKRLAVALSGYQVYPLDRGGDGQLLQTLHNDEGEASGYRKLGEAYVQWQLGAASRLSAGRMVLATPLLNDNDSRSTPSSTQVLKLDTQLERADFYAIYSDRAANRADNRFGRYRAANDESYDLYLLGGRYRFDNGAVVQLAGGEARDYLRKGYINGSLPVPLGEGRALWLDAHYYRQSDAGSLYGARQQATLLNLAARYQTGSLTLTASWQEVGGDNGYDYRWDRAQRDNNNPRSWNLLQYLTFTRDNEQSFQLRADYQVPSIPGLSWMARHTEGWNIRQRESRNLRERETGVDVQYHFFRGHLDGLSLRLRAARVVRQQLDDIHEIRLIANYHLRLR